MATNENAKFLHFFTFKIGDDYHVVEMLTYTSNLEVGRIEMLEKFADISQRCCEIKALDKCLDADNTSLSIPDGYRRPNTKQALNKILLALRQITPNVGDVDTPLDITKSLYEIFFDHYQTPEREEKTFNYNFLYWDKECQKQDEKNKQLYMIGVLFSARTSHVAGNLDKMSIVKLLQKHLKPSLDLPALTMAKICHDINPFC